MTHNRFKCSLLEASRDGGDLSLKIVRGAFDEKDLQTQTSLGFEHLLENQRLGLKAKQYTDIAISMMKQLAQDIYLAIDLFKPDDWEPSTLQDALKLLRYTLDNLFGGGDITSGKAKGLGVAFKCCTDSPLKKKFFEVGNNAWGAYDNLLNHLNVHGPVLGDIATLCPDDKISTATFLELIIRNEAQKIVRTKHELTERDLDKYSSHWLVLEGQGKFEGSASPAQSWHPATIVIVQDKATRWAFTGASKARAVGIPALQRVAYNTTVRRLGRNFRREVDKCNEEFKSLITNQHIESNTPPHWFRELKESKIPIFQNSTSNGTGPPSVVGLALNIPPTHNKPPCTRSQCFYPSWCLHQRPKTDKDRWTLYQKEYIGTQFDGTEFGFSYCAETVAAAQLFSLYTGNVISDVQEDTLP